ncbi:MAG: hypothetical protein P8O03_16205 [Ilumatobacter sp.]|nr:hypothetical protein [Ilumatobacter sp.]MDG2039123.1 hypothetical protein [Ilumatobacter sp.]
MKSKTLPNVSRTNKMINIGHTITFADLATTQLAVVVNGCSDIVG